MSRYRPLHSSGAWVALLLIIRSVGLAEPEPITTISAIRDLTPAEADRGLPVQVSGVITYLEPSRHLAFLQNGPHAIYVLPVFANADDPSSPAGDLAVGDTVEVMGVTMAGSFAPAITGKNGGPVLVRRQGRAELPGPVRPLRGNLLDPSLDCLWIEVEGLVRRVARRSNRLFIEMTSGRILFTVIIPQPGNLKSDPETLVDASVQVRGVFGSLTNERRQLVGVRLYTPHLRFIKVLDGSADSLWKRPPLGVEELMRFRQSTVERVRVQGHVTAVFPGDGIFLRTGDGSIRVSTPQAGSVKVGQWVDAVGFSVMDGNRPALEDALLHPGPEGPAPEPVPLRPASLTDPERHGELVSVRATLLDRFSRVGETLLLLGDGHSTFTARLPAEDLLASLPLQSLVQVTGIALIQPEFASLPAGDSFDQGSATRGHILSLALRDQGDVTLLRRPPFWTQDRILSTLAVLALSLLLLVFWLVALRRKVQSQTRIISEKAARQQVLEERARIARELHDTLEQELAGIGLQLDLARSRLSQSDERLWRPVDLALRMLRRCQNETRRSIANLRSTQLEQSDLAAALQAITAEQSAPGGPQLKVSVTGSPVKLPVPADHHLLRFFQEGLTNALKHAQAKSIDLRLTYESGRVLAEIKDDGIGFELAAGLARQGHFGLRGIQERAAKLGAELVIDTAPGRGTILSMTLPIRTTHQQRSDMAPGLSIA